MPLAFSTVGLSSMDALQPRNLKGHFSTRGSPLLPHWIVVAARWTCWRGLTLTQLDGLDCRLPLEPPKSSAGTFGQLNCPHLPLVKKIFDCAFGIVTTKQLDVSCPPRWLTWPPKQLEDAGPLHERDLIHRHCCGLLEPRPCVPTGHCGHHVTTITLNLAHKVVQPAERWVHPKDLRE